MPPARTFWSSSKSQGKNRLALVQEVQHAPVGGDVLHIDFHAVSMDEVIEADVPLEPVGHCQWREEHGRIARAKPAHARRSNVFRAILPDVIRVDVSALNIGDAIHVREIQLPSGVSTRSPAGFDRLLGPRSDGGRRAGRRRGGSCRRGRKSSARRRKSRKAAALARARRRRKKSRRSRS